MSIETVQTGYPGLPWTLIAFITRKPGISREEFSLHWQNTHAVLVAPWAEKWGITKYRQVSDNDHADSQFVVLSRLGISLLKFLFKAARPLDQALCFD
jgi:hypothetical protein